MIQITLVHILIIFISIAIVQAISRQYSKYSWDYASNTTLLALFFVGMLIPKGALIAGAIALFISIFPSISKYYKIGAVAFLILEVLFLLI